MGASTSGSKIPATKLVPGHAYSIINIFKINYKNE